MLWKIKDEIWFDSEKLFIIKGKENYMNIIKKSQLWLFQAMEQ